MASDNVISDKIDVLHSCKEKDCVAEAYETVTGDCAAMNPGRENDTTLVQPVLWTAKKLKTVLPFEKVNGDDSTFKASGTT